MIPKEITAAHVVAAMAELDKSGIPSARGSTRYELVRKGKRYPPKYLVTVAAKYAIGRELHPSEFNGGTETNSFLAGLGFIIEKLTAAPQQNRQPARRPRQAGRLAHDERCKNCKSTVALLLQKLYGKVEVNKRFEIGTSPEALASSAYLPQLQEIFEALKHARGFQDFVRSASLPPCDYFVPDPGFVLEFDESQHFTPLRAVALAQYPASLPLGFDRESWINLCNRINARDSEPPYRDEQRAWYDTLRDFLPTILQLNPTVRIYASEHAWCELDPASAEDLERFRQILSERTQLWSIAIGTTQNPRFARIVIDGAWAGDLNAARCLLNGVAVAWPREQRVICLCTCGAFIRFNWPSDLPCQGNRNPDSHEIQVLTAAAEQAVRSVLSNEVVGQLRSCCHYLTLGIDTRKEKISTTYNIISQPHAELVCLVDLRKGILHWTGKFYPTPQQQRTILRFPDLRSHFVELDHGVTMILGCHDLSVYSPRGQATARGWKKQEAARFRSLAVEKNPVAVLHHPHTTVKTGTWRQQWRRLEEDLPCVTQYLGTGAYSYQDNGWGQRDELPDILAATERGDVLNVVVRLGVTGRGY